MSHELHAQVLEELDKLRDLCAPLPSHLARFRTAPPDAWDRNALGGLLHSFYCGVENVLRAVAEQLDGAVPKTPSWHSDLLESMASPSSTRGGVLSRSLADELNDYLGFRHVYRSHYGFELEWERMEPLAGNLQRTLNDFDQEIRAFLAGLPADG